ncbi:polysaccharide biosynthesis tyrosine autokinase [Altererythrobacter sediminis]|uniref:Polysaccharide biosynthesis tyrosine autokinase n=1 Tax=Allopontixanthobacter sediminis TaxID=1689985 RepID=A0A845B4B8_9SPHN|nr:polysaccharide biosynthesis tyrosine autokinase [Allopontixanthobacter sediminis]
MAAAVGLATILTLLAQPQFTATTRIEIARASARIVNVDAVEPEGAAVDQEFYQTQYGLLGSASLAGRVMRKLRLADNEGFIADMGLESVIEEKGNDRAAREAEVVKALVKNVSISPIRLSRLVDISFTGPDPVLAARISNSWAEAFIESNIERRFESTAFARDFLEKRLDDVRQRLEESERQLVGYASQQAIINLPGATSENGDLGRDRSLVSENLAFLNNELAEATAARISAEARVRSARGGSSSEALTNIAISGMREKLAEVESEYSRLLTEFSPEYPAAKSLAAQAERLRTSIALEENRIGSSISNDLAAAAARERSLDARVENLKDQFLDQRRRGIQYNIFQREVDTNRQLYDGLLQRYKEIGAAAGIGSNNVSIVDEAKVPDRPSSPRPALNLALALIAGLGLGVIIALIRDQLDESISDPGEVEGRIGLPLLGVVPAVSADRIDEIRDPKSGLAEAYLSIETNLGFVTDHGVPRSLMVTSTRPAEGKSTTSFALAAWIARRGSRTLLIDADLRSPSMHEYLGAQNEGGLSNYLSGSDDLDSLIQRDLSDRFDFLSTGPSPPNAADLLRGDRLKKLLAILADRYDNVVIDAPPVMGLADAPIIASNVEATVFVLEAQGIKTRLAERAIERLRSSHANIIGAILTKFNAKASQSGYDYGYGYGYGVRYGEQEKV